MSNIPEGYELLSGRSAANAQHAIALADERGVPSWAVLTQQEGYLIPLSGDSFDGPDDGGLHRADEQTPSDESREVPEDNGSDEIELPKPTASKAEQEAFAQERGIDLTDTTNAETRHEAIVAWANAQKTNPETQGE